MSESTNSQNKKSVEFIKRFNTCGAKFNLIFAYSSASELKWEDMKTTTFAIIRYYGEYCFLDVQKLIISYYPDEDHDWEFLKNKLDGLDAYLTLILKNIDN